MRPTTPWSNYNPPPVGLPLLPSFSVSALDATGPGLARAAWPSLGKNMVENGTYDFISTPFNFITITVSSPPVGIPNLHLTNIPIGFSSGLQVIESNPGDSLTIMIDQDIYPNPLSAGTYLITLFSTGLKILPLTNPP